MKITVYVTEEEDGESVEEYDSREHLAQDLEDMASAEYAEDVLRRIDAGEKDFTVANGPGASDRYVVTTEA